MDTGLSPGQSAELKAALRTRFEALQEEIRQDLLKGDEHREAGLADRVRDLQDESVATLIADLDLADTDRDLEELQDVEAALRRMHEGRYGTCLGCGDPIAFERLRAYPTAKRCRRCQARHEASFVQKGMPRL